MGDKQLQLPIVALGDIPGLGSMDQDTFMESQTCERDCFSNRFSGH